MKTYALSKAALSAIDAQQPNIEITLEKLRRYEAADTSLQQACFVRGIEKPKLVAKSR